MCFLRKHINLTISSFWSDLDLTQGRSKQGGCNGCRCTCETQRAPRGPLTRLCGATIVNFLGIHTSLPAAKCAPLMCQGAQAGPSITAGAPWSRPVPQSNSKRGPFADYGAPWGPCMAVPPWPDAPVSKNPSFVYDLTSVEM